MGFKEHGCDETYLRQGAVNRIVRLGLVSLG